MALATGGARSLSDDLGGRRQIALERIEALIARYEERSKRAWRSYYVLQGLTIGLAALTPCLIFLANSNPNNKVFEWLQLFFPAIAAISAGVSHVFKWREEGVHYASLAEGIRSQMWRYQTRSGELGPALSDEQALDRLVTQVDDFNLRSLQRWSASQLTEPPAPGKAKAATAES
jgi:hypothetical protein